VKNLPPSLTSKDFKTHFSHTSSAENSLNVTDVKLVHKKDGTFRRFGFIGYKTSADAQRAQEWFNGTYFGSCKIQVEIIEDVRRH
jgi:multiple RNA-binding domain-containing protein 1